jgi:hypothetical protein
MARIIYQFDDGQLLLPNGGEASAQPLGEALAALAEANDGDLTPEVIVEAAKLPGSVLHPHFEWNDGIAGHSWRKHQARHLQARITYLDEDDVDQVEPRRLFVSINAGAGTSYRMTSEVIGSRALQEAALKGLLRDLGAFERRARQFADACKLMARARGLLEKRLATLRTEIEGEPPSASPSRRRRPRKRDGEDRPTA